ncbi:glycosyl hydrolase family 95 catalytic domain-containing protein [uncultured Propionibacterium sp.]|uniref:glycosyl hydrolase family 95 catalytic domain-containing protein n=1 Tax=uncultured Propionibacterium sp. TaxID=218066 RepID=UPI00293129A8|nr:glycoside hydrolase N-terminal domain-containing protein [uncultured Propionibacterium sp.]
MRYRIILDEPATNPRDAFLLGNGHLGAVAHGGIGAEILELSLDALWSGGPAADTAGDGGRADAAMLLPALRAAIASGDLGRAEELAARMTVAPAVQTCQPVGALRWEYAPGLRTRGYSRELDLQNATMTTTVRGNVLRSFVSAPAGALVAQWDGRGALKVPTMRSPHHGSVRTWREGQVLWLTFASRVPADARTDEPVRYGTELPEADGSVRAGMAFAVAAVVQTTGEGPRLIVAAESGFTSWNRRPSGDASALEHVARYRVRRAMSRSTDELHAEHVADYRALFDRSNLDLSESWRGATDELVFHLGKYLLISSSRPGSQPVHAQGLWNARARPAGEAYRADASLQMSYWSAEKLGLPECAAPLRRMVSELAQTGRDRAWKNFGFSGAVVFERIDLWRASSARISRTRQSHWLGALPSLASCLYEHALFTGDIDRALQVHRMAARFALDLLVLGPDDDLVASPSVAPGQPRSGTDALRVAAGSTIDREVIAEVFEHYLALAGEQPHGLDVALAEQVRGALAHLAPVPVVDGVIARWGERWTSGRGTGSDSLLHLYGLFPGRRINHTDPAMVGAARRTLEAGIAHGAGRTAAGQARILAMAARLGDEALAARALTRLTGQLSSSSLLTLGSEPQMPGAVLQLPASLALPGALAEMLVGDDAGVIRLLAALPARWPKGSARGLRAVGGHRVDVTWDENQLTGARITPNFGCAMQVEAENGRFTITDDAGAPVQFAQVAAWNRNRNLLSFQVADGRSYVITREGRARRAELTAGAPAVSIGTGISMTLSGLPTV